jgi:tRNA1Val (adenine37-N6)-methyltransferase
LAASQNISADTFYNGRIKVFQTSRGYRFSLDAVLLAAIAHPKPGDILMDIGTGCGIVPILLAFRYPQVRYVGIEFQPKLAKIALKNVAANHMDNNINILNQDIRTLKHEMVPTPMDWIVSNPPYWTANSGRINPNSERALARHEIHLSLHELVQVCRRFLKTGGRFATIYPVERLVDLFTEMRMAGIEPKWMQNVHSRQGDEAKLALVQGVMRGRPGLKMASALTLYEPDGSYTQVVQKMIRP